MTDTPETDAPDGEAGNDAALAPLSGGGDFEERATDDPALVIDVEGFEGPLDLLLMLARSQKVDLTHISILALAEQYLVFIEQARRLRLDIAADYLVMAAWLAYLKSRLLLPVKEDEDEPSAEEMAAALAFRLRRLEAMRDASAKLMNRDRLGRDTFARGMPEAINDIPRAAYDVDLFELLTAYAAQRARSVVTRMQVGKRTVWSLQDAREILVRLVGKSAEWMPLETFLTRYLRKPEDRATILASSFSASLELVKDGTLEIRQSGTFAPLYVRGRGEEGKDGGKG
ncbi:MAG: segregation/condensation protein A [Hyphomicrobiales bacterium]|nr:MAG: segregation/condensation protein A [Hyphomicrobiales bacterium]